MAAEEIFLLDQWINARIDRTGVQPHADGRVGGQAQLFPVHVLHLIQQTQGEVGAVVDTVEHEVETVSPRVAEDRLAPGSLDNFGQDIKVFEEKSRRLFFGQLAEVLHIDRKSTRLNSSP